MPYTPILLFIHGFVNINVKINQKPLYFHGFGGETGIRTQEELAPLTDFKTVAFDRSAISPYRGLAREAPLPLPLARLAIGAVAIIANTKNLTLILIDNS